MLNFRHINSKGSLRLFGFYSLLIYMHYYYWHIPESVMHIYEASLKPLKTRLTYIFLHLLEWRKMLFERIFLLSMESVVLAELAIFCFLGMADTCTKLFTWAQNCPNQALSPGVGLPAVVILDGLRVFKLAFSFIPPVDVNSGTMWGSFHHCYLCWTCSVDRRFHAPVNIC